MYVGTATMMQSCIALIIAICLTSGENLLFFPITLVKFWKQPSNSYLFDKCGKRAIANSAFANQAEDRNFAITRVGTLFPHVLNMLLFLYYTTLAYTTSIYYYIIIT